MAKLTSFPVLGSPVTKKNTLAALKAPLTEVPYSSSGTEDGQKLNSLIQRLRTMGLLEGSTTGPEVFDPAAPLLGSGVTNDGGNHFTVVSGTQMIGMNSLVAGRTYRAYFEWTYTGGSHIRVNNSNTNGAAPVGSVGITTSPAQYEVTFTATDTYLWLEADLAVFSGTIENISVTEVLP